MLETGSWVPRGFAGVGTSNVFEAAMRGEKRAAGVVVATPQEERRWVFMASARARSLGAWASAVGLSSSFWNGTAILNPHSG
jgi:hypothetical protein